MRNRNNLGMAEILLGAILMASGPLFGADQKAKVSSETMKNPITGTVTRSTKVEKHVKHRDGKSSDVNVEEKTQYHQDGTVEDSLDAKTKTTPKTE